MRRGDSALKGREVARSGSKGSRNEVTSNKVRWNEVEWVQVKESMAYNDPAPTLPLVISSFLLCLSVVPIRMSMSSKIKKSNKQGRCSLSFSFFLSTFHFVLEKPDQFLDLIALYSTLSISTQPPHLHSPFFLSHLFSSSNPFPLRLFFSLSLLWFRPLPLVRNSLLYFPVRNFIFERSAWYFKGTPFFVSISIFCFLSLCNFC